MPRGFTLRRQSQRCNELPWSHVRVAQDGPKCPLWDVASRVDGDSDATAIHVFEDAMARPVLTVLEKPETRKRSDEVLIFEDR